MNITDYEELAIGMGLKWSNEASIMDLWSLQPILFEAGPRRQVYETMLDCVMEGIPPDLPNVVANMGKALDRIGGADYLRILESKPIQFSMYEPPSNLKPFTDPVVKAGQYRQILDILGNANREMTSLEKAMEGSKNPQRYIGELMARLAKVTGVSSQYEPLSNALIKAKSYAEDIRTGNFENVVINVGWPSWERLSIPRPSTYMVLSGLSSVGKTQLALQLCLGTAIAIKNKGEDACVAIHEFEQTDQSMAIRLICCMAGLDSTHLDRGDFTKDDYVLFDLMADRLSELPIVFNTHTGVTRTQVGNAIHAQSNKLPVKMALVDYPELQADTGDTEEIRVATIARYYQGISRQTQTCIIGIYQYPKLDTVSMMAGYANERYSAGITQAGDSVIEVYNPPAMRRNNIDFRVPKGFDEQFAYVVLKKNRDRKTGYFPMVWEPEFVRFSDPRIEVTFGHEVYDLDTAWMYKGTGLTNEGDF